MSTAVDQLRRPKSGDYDIPELVELAVNGIIRVPKFQRSFVWDAADVVKLFDSIWRGFPIGTILLWRHPAPEGIIEFGPIRLHAPHRDDALMVVDGQQRITSLLGALTEYGDQANDDRFDVYFDLLRQRFVGGRRRPILPSWLPLREALESRRLLSWMRENGDDLEPEAFEVAESLVGTIRDYKIPRYIVEGDDDILLREVFDRVNSAGKPIRRADVFHALFAANAEPGSPATVVESLSRLGFGQIDADKVVQGLLALRGGNVARDVHDEFGDREQIADWYDKTEQALHQVIDFLRDEEVPHSLLVPSTLPIPVLAAFFYLHGRPDGWNRRLLSRWMWRGWTHDFGKRGQTPALRQAVRAVNPKKNIPEQAPPPFDALRALLELVPDGEPSVIDTRSLRTNSAQGKLALLALASRRPRDLDGNALDIAKQLEQYGIDAVTELVFDHRADFAARGFWPVDSPMPTGEEDEEILESHLISQTAAVALRNGDISRFIEIRRQDLMDLTRRYLTAKVDPKAIIRRSLNESPADAAEPLIL